MQQNLTRREALKRGAMTAGALAWATPVMQVVGISPAYAQETSPGDKDCCIDAEGKTVKLAVLVMTYLGGTNFCDSSAYTQADSLVTCIDSPLPAALNLPDPAYIIASNQSDPFNPDGTTKNGSRIWFSDTVMAGSTFSIDATNVTGETRLKGETWIHIFWEDPVATGDPVSKLRQKVGFHTSCSEPLFTGDQFGSLLLTGCEPDTTPAIQEAPAAETQELEQESEPEGTGETGQQPEDPQDVGAGQSQTPDVTVPDQAEGQPGPPDTTEPEPEPGEDEPTP